MGDAAEAPKFSVWLGDNWPGPYVVTYELHTGRTAHVVVNGVTSIEDALAVADAEFPRAEALCKSISISPSKVAEASHHMALLTERRKEREKEQADAKQ